VFTFTRGIYQKRETDREGVGGGAYRHRARDRDGGHAGAPLGRVVARLVLRGGAVHKLRKKNKKIKSLDYKIIWFRKETQAVT